MTLEELKRCDKAFVSPKAVAEILGCTPYTINVQAKADPRKLGFPVSIMGTRVRIPRAAFLNWLQYGSAAAPAGHPAYAE